MYVFFGLFWVDIELKEDGNIFVIKKVDIITPHLLLSLLYLSVERYNIIEKLYS